MCTHYTVLYSPILDVGDQVCSSVVAVGCIGVWRMISYDFGRSDLSVCGDLALAVPAFQPEDHKYLITEISCNGEMCYSAYKVILCLYEL